MSEFWPALPSFLPPELARTSISAEERCGALLDGWRAALIHLDECEEALQDAHRLIAVKAKVAQLTREAATRAKSNLMSSGEDLYVFLRTARECARSELLAESELSNARAIEATAIKTLREAQQAAQSWVDQVNRLLLEEGEA